VVQITSDGGAIVITSTSYSTSTAPLSLTSSNPASSTGANGSLNDSAGGGGSGFFHNTGAVVGVFLVVGLAAAALLLGAGLLYIRRKRARALDEDIRVAAGGAGAGGAGTSRFHDDDDMDYADSDGSQPTYPVMAQYGSNAYAGLDEPSSHSHGANRMSFAPSMGSIGTAGVAAGAYGYGASSEARSPPSSGNDHFYYAQGGQQAGEPGHSEWADYVNACGSSIAFDEVLLTSRD
jgi:LPXTG-motif cell wall-anchored protein